VWVPIIEPHEQRIRPRSSHARAKYFRSVPLLLSMVVRARSTRTLGKKAGTGTAIHSSFGRIWVVLRFL
jgi:hypothetical protein